MAVRSQGSCGSLIKSCIQCTLFCCSHLLSDKITDEKGKICEIARLQNEVNTYDAHALDLFVG